MSNFSIKADLLKLKNSFITNIKGKTATKKCLVIPIEDAKLFLGEKGVYLDLTAIEMREARYDDTHIVKQNFTKEVYEAMTEEEKEAQPILGSLKPLKPSPAKQMEVKNSMDAETAFDNDDLPF
ncbi:MAG: hypothetical protein ACRCZB_01390 [Bacteroidales bacterium]